MTTSSFGEHDDRACSEYVMSGKQLPAYHSVALTDETYDKLEIWRAALDQRYDFRVTFSMAVEYLIDNAGVPQEASNE